MPIAGLLGGTFTLPFIPSGGGIPNWVTVLYEAFLFIIKHKRVQSRFGKVKWVFP